MIFNHFTILSLTDFSFIMISARMLKIGEFKMPKPSEILADKRLLISQVIQQFNVVNPRIFGSIIHKKDNENSDLDLLVDALPSTTLFDLGGLQCELEDLLGIKVDVKTPYDLPIQFREQVLQEAIPL